MASSRTARRRSACRRTCSGRCSNILLRSRARRSRRLRRERWRGVSTRTRRSRSGTCAARNGVLTVEPAAAKVVVQAFKRRDLGASLVELQAFLAENGIERALSGVAWMLRSRMYLGEIHFGDLHNLNAHEPIVKDRGLFERVQRRTVSRGRQAKSERLLARWGVLRW